MTYCTCCGTYIYGKDEKTPEQKAILEISEHLIDVERRLEIVHNQLKPMLEAWIKHESGQIFTN